MGCLASREAMYLFITHWFRILENPFELIMTMRGQNLQIAWIDDFHQHNRDCGYIEDRNKCDTISSTVLYILTFLLVTRKWYNWALILEVSPQSWLQAATDPHNCLLQDVSTEKRKKKTAQTLQTRKSSSLRSNRHREHFWVRIISVWLTYQSLNVSQKEEVCSR